MGNRFSLGYRSLARLVNPDTAGGDYMPVGWECGTSGQWL